MKQLQTVLGLSFIMSANVQATNSADAIYTNANFYTQNDLIPYAQEVGVKNKRIVCLDDCSAFKDRATKIYDLKGRFVLPGFIDSHNHVSYSMGAKFLSLMNVATYDEFRNKVQAFSDANPDVEWIMGDGWNYGLFDGGMPTAKDLDGVTGGRPAFFASYDAHTRLLNTKAMELFGITNKSKHSAIGEIYRDKEGNPTGVFKSSIYISDADQAKLDSVLPEPDYEDIYQGFIGNLNLAASVGITTIVEPQMYPEGIEMFERAQAENKLNAHIRLALFHPPKTNSLEVAEFVKIKDRFKNNPDIQVPALKLYIDDVIEAQTAALHEPYVGTDNVGDLFFDAKNFKRIITDLDKKGFQLFIHAIGDRGITTAIDALESAYRSNGKPKTPHQLVHIELIKDEDVQRLASLNISAAIQPRHMSPDIAGVWQESVGEYRYKYAWPLAKMRKAGVRFAFSSDWNVAEMDPLIGIYTAVTRQGLTGEPKGGWQPQEKLDLKTTIAGYTIQGAISNGIEHDRGSLEVGKFADMVVLSDNLFNINSNAIKDVKILKTIFEGEVVYEKE